MRRFKKILLVFSCIIFLIPIVLILFISPITKYVIEKYDAEYTGREITMDWVYVNPFSGYAYFKNLKIYEYDKKGVFFSADGLSLGFSIRKLFSKTYEINDLTLDNPRCLITQDKKKFNFNDLINKFSPKKNSDTIPKAPVHFNILHIKINAGKFYYIEKQIPINYFIKQVNFESPGIRWDVDTIACKFSFLNGFSSGEIKGNFSINLKNNDYRLATVVRKFDLNIIQQYLKELSNYGTFSASLDADVKAKGNFNDKKNISSSGLVSINDFHFGKNHKEDYASFKKLMFVINKLSPSGRVYDFDSVSIDHPYFKYERYDYLDNLQTMFGKKGAKIAAVNSDPSKFNLIIEIAKYIKELSKDFFRSDYRINRFEICNGDIKYNDYSLSEKFSVDLNPLTIISDSIDKNRSRAKIFLRSGIKPYGNIAAALSIDPKDSENFELHYYFQKLPVPMFNPYTSTYTSFPLDRGTIEFNGKWNVSNGIIQSENHLVIIDPRVTKRIRAKDRKWIPLPLIMSFIRERGNVIDYEIPITGNLKDPKFHWKDVILDLLKNIFVKPPTTPYRLEVKNIETEIEKDLSLKWQMRQNLLRPNQERFIEKIADFLKKNPEVEINVLPCNYMIKEKEYILLFEAKKKYFLITKGKSAKSFCESDSEAVNKMSIKDSLFVHYLNKETKGIMLFTIQEKCAKIIDSSIVNIKFNQLKNERENAFLTYFKNKEVENQVKFSNPENIIPYNGFSFYKIEYKGEFPESLIKAYQKMNDLNEEPPRDKFKKEREKINL